MPTNFKTFNAAISRKANKITGNFKLFYMKLGLDILTGVVLKTPVDTGRARGNWQLNVETFDEIPIDIIDTSGQSTINKGMTNVKGFSLGQTIYIYNNVEYIVPLEAGHSQQAPRGMLALTLQEVRVSIK